jgi:hypothetical protein
MLPEFVGVETHLPPAAAITGKPFDVDATFLFPPRERLGAENAARRCRR